MSTERVRIKRTIGSWYFTLTVYCMQEHYIYLSLAQTEPISRDYEGDVLLLEETRSEKKNIVMRKHLKGQGKGGEDVEARVRVVKKLQN